MSSDFDIQGVANLARIKVDPAQAKELKDSIENVLGFIDQIKQAKVPDVKPENFFRLIKNRLRPDANPAEPGINTEVIMRVAPNKKDGYFKVKKMINPSTSA